MREYFVHARYDVWGGVWRADRTSVPGLSVEAATSELFREAVEERCEALAADRDHEVSTVFEPKKLWALDLPWLQRVIVNGRLVSRERARALMNQFSVAG
jgi:hypothetical protein